MRKPRVGDRVCLVRAILDDRGEVWLPAGTAGVIERRERDAAREYERATLRNRHPVVWSWIVQFDPGNRVRFEVGDSHIAVAQEEGQR